MGPSNVSRRWQVLLLAAGLLGPSHRRTFNNARKIHDAAASKLTIASLVTVLARGAPSHLSPDGCAPGARRGDFGRLLARGDRFGPCGAVGNLSSVGRRGGARNRFESGLGGRKKALPRRRTSRAALNSQQTFFLGLEDPYNARRVSRVTAVCCR